MAVPGLRAGGFMIHFWRSSGPLLGTAPPAMRLREATPARLGPMVPAAPGMPGIVWQAPQPFCWMSAAPAAGSAPPGAGGAGAGEGLVAGAGAVGAGAVAGAGALGAG